MKDAQYWITQLALQKHPEGGYYREILRSKDELKVNVGKHQGTTRSLYTSIYFLMTSDNFSAWHRIKSDELWHWHSGSSLTVFVIDEKGSLEEIQLGEDLASGETLTTVVQAGYWFASAIRQKDTYSLVSCTVIPGFSFDDFELAKANKLIEEFPQHKGIITKYCRI